MQIDFHQATICHKDRCFVYFWVAALHRFYCIKACILFDLILYISVNSFSVMLWQIFLNWTSTKQRIKCLAQEYNTASSEARFRNPSISSQTLYHLATGLLMKNSMDPDQLASYCRWIYSFQNYFNRSWNLWLFICCMSVEHYNKIWSKPKAGLEFPKSYVHRALVMLIQ